MLLSIIGVSQMVYEYNHSETFDLMLQEALRTIEKYDTNTLIVKSGGSCWSDHIAVVLFLQGKIRHLSLHLPCNILYDDKSEQYTFDASNQSGCMLNARFKEFSDVMGRNCIKDIVDAVRMGCKYTVYNGFFARNRVVAECDVLIAYSMGKSKPEKGGTLYTWNQCKALTKQNICIKTLK